MARVIFKSGQAIQSLSGILGDLVYQTRNGKTFVYKREIKVPLPTASRAEKARYRRLLMINECVRILQGEIKDVVSAIGMRKKFFDRISCLYDKYVQSIKAPTKLQRRIMEEYRSRY